MKVYRHAEHPTSATEFELFNLPEGKKIFYKYLPKKKIHMIAELQLLNCEVNAGWQNLLHNDSFEQFLHKLNASAITI